MTTGHEERFRRLYAEESVARLARLSESALALEDVTRAAGEGAEDDPGVRATLESMFREAHTLKGGAAVVGFRDVSRVAYALEDVLDELRAGRRRASADLVDGMLVAVDGLRAVIDLAVRGEPHADAADAAVAGISPRRDEVPDEAPPAPAVAPDGEPTADRGGSLDLLTALPDRRALERQLRVLEARPHSPDGRVSAVLVDVDHLGQVNEGWGRPAGDAVLVAVADAVAGCARPDGLAGRWGDDEFLLLLPRADLAGAAALAEQLRRRVEVTPVPVGTVTLTVTVSAGCAAAIERGGEDLVARATRALRTAQEEGRNRVAPTGAG